MSMNILLALGIASCNECNSEVNPLVLFPSGEVEMYFILRIEWNLFEEKMVRPCDGEGAAYPNEGREETDGGV
jgi:hypothetical protein